MLPLRDANPVRARPLVTWALIAVNIAVYVFVQPSSFKFDMSPKATDDGTEFLYKYAMVPCELSHGEPLTQPLVEECGGRVVGVVPNEEALFDSGKNIWLSIVASMFLHANLLHIAGNMFFLWIFGDNVEDRLRRGLYLVFYLVGGAVAALGHVLSDPDSLAPVVGASGAVAAVMGAYLVQSPRAKLTAIIPPLFFLPFRVPAWIFLVLWLALQFFTSANSGIAWVAHVAGFAAGVCGAFLLKGVTRRPPRPVWER